MDQFNDNIQPKKKSSALKWTMIGCGGLVALAVIIVGIGFYFFSQMVTTNPVKVEVAAQEILSFDKPQGFKGGFSMNTAAMKIVTFVGADASERGSTLVLASLPPGSNQESMQQNMLTAIEQRGNGKMHITENRPSEEFRVQGKDATSLVDLVQQGGDSAPRLLRYAITLHGSSGNMVVLMLMKSEQTATHEWVQRFLDTVKSPQTVK
jgi:hypothetical protein